MSIFLSTSVNIYCERPSGEILPLSRTLPVIRKAGFKVLDMSFYEYAFEGSPFLTDNWERWIDEVANLSDKLGISFYQGHAYTYNFLHPKYHLDESEKKWQDELVKRSLICCQKLGTKVIVTHPGINQKDSLDLIWKGNRDYFSSYLVEADRRNMKVAIENMWKYFDKNNNRFFSEADEIADFIDLFEDERIGVCWDYEHGDILELNQVKATHTLGKRLFATHISDTNSKTFEPYMHLMPFSGFTDWSAIIRALKEIAYNGAFSFEAHNFAKKIPDELIPSALKYGYDIGKYLMSL